MIRKPTQNIAWVFLASQWLMPPHIEVDVIIRLGIIPSLPNIIYGGTDLYWNPSLYREDWVFWYGLKMDGTYHVGSINLRPFLRIWFCQYILDYITGCIADEGTVSSVPLHVSSTIVFHAWIGTPSQLIRTLLVMRSIEVELVRRKKMTWVWNRLQLKGYIINTSSQ